ncbi:MAG TPA: PKD domain-containing protein [Thermoanaerobaculia bacterium]
MTFTRTSNQTSTPTPPPTPTPLPGASFSFQPACPAPGQTVSFFYTAQSGATSWNWDFGDPGSGSADISTVRTPVHIFANAGRYTVTVTARGLAGFVKTQQVVRVAPSGPLVAHFDVDRPRPRQGQTVYVFDTSSGCPSSWSWDFGDKPSGLLNNSSSRDASHVYANPGTYTIRLVITSGQQSFATTTRVTVVCARCPIVVAPRAKK